MQVEIDPLTCNHPVGRGKKKKKKIMDVEGGGTARRRSNKLMREQVGVRDEMIFKAFILKI